MGKAKAQNEMQPDPALPRIHTVRKQKVMLILISPLLNPAPPEEESAKSKIGDHRGNR